MKVRKTIDVEFPGLGGLIKGWRKADRRSLAQICREIDMSIPNWYKIEKSKVKVLPVDTLMRIADVLGVEIQISFKEGDRNE